MDAEETALLRSSLRAAFDPSKDPERALRELGSLELLADGDAAIAVLFEEQGRAGTSTSLLDRLMRVVLGLPADGAALVIPVPQSGLAVHAGTSSSDGGLALDGLIWASADKDEQFVVPVVSPDGKVGLFAAPATAVETSTVRGLIPGAGLVRVQGLVPGGTAPEVATTATWDIAVAHARRALASELVGVAEEISRIAGEHVTSRHQFGMALGSFQAVRHRLAEAHVEIEAARSLVTLAWAPGAPLETIDDVTDEATDLQILSAASKAASGRAYETASRHALQVCGAMGVTWEFPLHRAVRHGALLNGLLGDATALTAWLGARLLNGDTMPLSDPLVDVTAGTG